MQPNKAFITIDDNQNLIKKFLYEVVLLPRINIVKWSAITKQTPNIKIGYPGQHLASLLTGMPGERTGARGNDLVDGTEVKSCSRIDQLDKCSDCKEAVSRSEVQCPSCGSTNIKRNNDSKWLFSVKNENELKTLLHRVKRIVLLLGDYPNFLEQDFTSLRFQAYEIWPESKRHHRFAEIMSNYYQKIYLEHKKENANATPAPKNFWPYSYQFYLCNPIPIFSCTVTNANTEPKINIEYYVEPATDRSELSSAVMPIDLVTDDEIKLLIHGASDKEILKIVKREFLPNININKFKSLAPSEVKKKLVGISESLRSHLPVRADRIASARSVYARRQRLVE